MLMLVTFVNWDFIPIKTDRFIYLLLLLKKLKSELIYVLHKEFVYFFAKKSMDRLLLLLLLLIRDVLINIMNLELPVS